MARARKSYGFTALRIEGGILPPEFLPAIAALEAPHQGGSDYGLSRSLALKEELARYWRIANDLYARYSERRVRQDLAAWQVGVDEWLLPLLRSVLGYDDLTVTNSVVLSEQVFKLTHRACGGTVPLLLATHEFDLDRADPRFGYEGRRQSPHGLMQEYLNAEDKFLWGIVSNGFKLRILRDNPSLTRTSYIEVDLDLVFAEELYPDFAAFWLAAHASRLKPIDDKPSISIIETWRAKAHETGERALENLRDGVTEALRQIGNGFLQHGNNDDLRAKLEDGTLSPEHYFQQLLGLVYRLLFLFAAEERDLLHEPDASSTQRAVFANGYSLSRLRERALRRRYYDHHWDIWQSLQITFRALARGEPALGIPALGGLFRSVQCPDLDSAAIANERLLDAVRSLSFFRSENAFARVNYRDMGAEELGSVYESLLELQPVVDVNATPWAFDFIGDGNGETARDSERKLTGSYYTPSALVNEMIKSALDPVLAQAVAERPDDPRKAILDLNVLDPACGSGHFLLAAARRMAGEIARIESGRDTSDDAARQRALREVIQRCIYGVDRNPLAVELCKTALWIETVEPGKPLTFLDSHIQLGDSLVGILDPEIMAKGIPTEAYKPMTGDDREICSRLKKRNSLVDDSVQIEIFDEDNLLELAIATADLDAMPEETLDDVERKSAAWEAAREDKTLEREELRANLFVGAFFAEKTRDTAVTVPQTEDLNRIRIGIPQRQGVEVAVSRLARQHKFLHWRLAFPEIMQSGGFDVVLGNPPYLSAIDQRSAGFIRHKQFWTTAFSGARGAYDLFVLFLELTQQLLSVRGRASLLTPNKYLAAPYAEALRTLTTEGNRLYSITDVSRFGAFPDASVYPVISTLVGAPLSDDTPIVARLPSESSSGFDALSHDRRFITSLPNCSWGILLSRGTSLIKKIISESAPLGTLVEICASTTAAEADEFTAALCEEELSQGRAGWKAVNTGLIDPFHTTWGKRSMRHNGRRLDQPFLLGDPIIISPRRMIQYSRAKIIIAKLGKRLEAVFDARGEYAAFNVNFVFEEGDAGYYYLGQLNSKVSSWLYRQLFGALRMGGDYLQFQAPQLRAMPVVPYRNEKRLHRKIASLARRASACPNSTTLISAIDVEVSKTLALTDEDMISMSQEGSHEVV